MSQSSNTPNSNCQLFNTFLFHLKGLISKIAVYLSSFYEKWDHFFVNCYPKIVFKQFSLSPLDNNLNNLLIFLLKSKKYDEMIELFIRKGVYKKVKNSIIVEL